MKIRQYLILFACAQIATTLVAMHDQKVTQTEEAQVYWRIPIEENLVDPHFDLTKSFALGRSLSSQAGYYLSFPEITTRDERTNAEQIANSALINQAQTIISIHPNDEFYKELTLDEEFKQRIQNISKIEDRREKICWILEQMQKHNLEISQTSINKLKIALNSHAINHQKLAKLVQTEVKTYAEHSFEAHRLAFKLTRIHDKIGYIEKFNSLDILQLTTYLAGEQSDQTKHFDINNLNYETTDFTKSFLNLQNPDYIKEEEDFSYYFYNSPISRPMIWQTAIVFAYLINKKHFDYYSGYDMDEYTKELKKDIYKAENDVQTIFNEYRKAFDRTLEYVKVDNDIQSRWWVHLESIKTLIPLMFIAQKAYNKVAITVNFLDTWREALLDYADNERTLLRQTLTLCANELARDHYVLQELAKTCQNTDYNFQVPEADFTTPKLVVSDWLPGQDPIDYGIYSYEIEKTEHYNFEQKYINSQEEDIYPDNAEYNEHKHPDVYNQLSRSDYENVSCDPSWYENGNY
jgi:hypothetical protein